MQRARCFKLTEQTPPRTRKCYAARRPRPPVSLGLVIVVKSSVCATAAAKFHQQQRRQPPQYYISSRFMPMDVWTTIWPPIREWIRARRQRSRTPENDHWTGTTRTATRNVHILVQVGNLRLEFFYPFQENHISL